MQVEHGGTWCTKCQYIPVPQQELIATRESNLAPLWLIFPNDIINTARIKRMTISNRITPSDGSLIIYMDDQTECAIPVKDPVTTWKALQTVFAEGLPKKN